MKCPSGSARSVSVGQGTFALHAVLRSRNTASICRSTSGDILVAFTGNWICKLSWKATEFQEFSVRSHASRPIGGSSETCRFVRLAESVSVSSGLDEGLDKTWQNALKTLARWSDSIHDDETVQKLTHDSYYIFNVEMCEALVNEIVILVELCEWTALGSPSLSEVYFNVRFRRRSHRCSRNPKHSFVPSWFLDGTDVHRCVS